MKQSVLSFLLLLLALISFKCAAQTPSGYSQPTSVAVCNTNGPFAVQNIAPPTGGWPTTSFTLSLEVFVAPPNAPFTPNLIPFPWAQFPDCIQGVTGNNPVKIKNHIIDPLFIIGLPVWNNLAHRYDFTVTLQQTTPASTPIEVLQFNLELDCSLIPELINGGSAVLVQNWFYNGTPAFSPTQIIPVQFPNIIEIPANSITINAPVNNSIQDWHFLYQNLGNAAANISITDFETEICLNQNGGNNYQLISPNPILFQVTNSPTTPTIWTGLGVFAYPFVTNVTIPSSQYLHFRQQVNILGCMTDCNGVGANPPLHVNFSWKCANTTAPPSCADCQKLYAGELNFNAGSSKYELRRINPSDAVALNNPECLGGATLWQYEVKNTGDANLKDISVYIGNSIFSPFSYISANSCSVNYNCSNPPNCYSLSTIPYLGNLPSTCSPLPNNLIQSFSVNLFELEPNQTCTLSFTVGNAGSEDQVFFNNKKFFNQWVIVSQSTTKCSSIIYPDYTNSRNGINQGISSHSITSANTTDDLNLLTTLNANPTHTTVYSPLGSTPPNWGDPVFYTMAFDGLFGNPNDPQALGGNSVTNVPMSGYLKVEIYCDHGLGIGNPKNVSLAFDGGLTPNQVFPIAYDVVDGFTCGAYPTTAILPPRFVNGLWVDVFPSLYCVCTEKTYTLYFKLSDLDNILPGTLTRDDFFLYGNLTFGFDPCCDNQSSPTDYSVKISLLPNESCFNLVGVNCSPVSPPATCCWIPLSSTNRAIFVHCPGCLAPGVIIDNYTMSRTTLGYPDFDDNGKAENTSNTIQYLPNQMAQGTTYSKYNQLKFSYAAYGDQLEDYLVAHFQDGENSSPFFGYEYSDMTSNSVFLDVLQLHRQFPLSDAAHYDVQVLGFDLYIDDPNPIYNAFPCIDEGDFQFQPNPRNTILVYSIDNTSPSFANFYTKAGTEMLFTFDRSQLIAPTLPLGVTRILPTNNLNDVDFRINQVYRIRVRYRVCGNPEPAAIGEEDVSSISDILFLTGTPKALPFNNNKMPDDAADVCLNTLGCFPLLNCSSTCTGTPVVTQTNLGDPFVYYCEGGGGDMHFISTKCSNLTLYGLEGSNAFANCVGIIDMRTMARFDKNMGYPLANKFFSYEYKAPKLFQNMFDVVKPANWDWQLINPANIDVSLTSYSCDNFTWCTNGSFPTPLSVSPSQSLNFDLSGQNLLFNCIDQTLPISSPFISDELSAQRIIFKLNPTDCGNMPSPLPEPVINSIVTFSDNEQTCSEPIPSAQRCSLDVVKDNSDATTSQRTLTIPNPNLEFSIIPFNYNVSTGQIQWEFDFKNEATITNPFPTDAKNVFLNVGNTLPGTWTVEYIYLPANQPIPVPVQGVPYGTLIAGPSTNNYFWLTPNTISSWVSLNTYNNLLQNRLAVGHRLHGVLTYTFSDCSLLANGHNFIGGWNCDITTELPISSNLCELIDEPVTFKSLKGDLTAIQTANPPYTPCSTTPITISANFINMGLTELKPEFITISTVPGSIVQITSNPTFTTNCTNFPNSPASPIYTLGSGGGNTWQINNQTPTNLLSQGECFTVQFQITTNGCHIGPLEMPVVTITGKDFCDNDFDCSINVSPLLPSNITLCNNCYTISKTVTPTSAQPGDPVTFTITINSNNSLATVITLNETLPPFFNMVPPLTFPMSLTLNPVSTTIIPVTGIFIDEGECVDLTNIAEIDHTGQSATACVDVACEFPHPGPRVIEIFDDEYLSSFTLSNTLSLHTIHVYDYKTLTIDKTIDFDNCTFIMGSGSSIIVQSQSPGQQITVNMDNSRLYSCPRMWQGIKVTEGTNFYMDASTLRDADKGVYLEDNAHFEIRNSFFYDCVVGVYSPTSNSGAMSNAFGTITGTEFGLNAFALKGNYSNINIPIAQDAFGTVGRAGILLNDIDLTIGDNAQPANIFSNINYGIEIHNSDVNVFNCAFRDIIFDQFYYPTKPYKAGAAIFAIATEPTYHLNVHPIVGATNQTITNANIGVYNERYNTNVSNLNMDQVNYGVWSERNGLCDVMVRNNNINSNNVGIYWFNNDRALRMMAFDNVINSSNICIYAHEYINDNNANYQITFNSELRSNSSFGGIYLSGVENAQVGYNTIYTDGNGIPSSSSVGIGLYDGRSNRLTCNYVLSTIPHSNLNSFGMRVNISPDNTISCNNFNASTTGVFFGGLCNNTIFSTNLMQNNWVGLQLNNVALIDDQVRRGNQWNNYQSPNGAQIFSNPSTSRFFVHTPPGSTFNPAVNVSGWFLPLSGTPDNCAVNQTCNAAIVDPPSEFSATDFLVATDSLQTTVYNDETRSIARQYLFEKMQSDTIDTWTDSVFVTFYNETSMSPIGELNRVSTTLAHSLDFDLNEYALLSLADSLIKLKSDSIHLIDSLQLISPFLNYKIVREKIILQLNNLRNVVRSILTSKALQQGILRDSARLINSAIQPTELPEQNQQIFNEIAALYQEYGDTIIESNYNSLLSIAQQCPFSGGGVVYKVRDFLRRVNDSLEYYDDAVCLQYGIFRVATTNGQFSEDINIKLIPNPASSTVDVIVYPALEEFCRITIINTMGEVVFSAVGDKNAKLKTVDISNFANGIYVVSVRSSSLLKNAKLTITR